MNNIILQLMPLAISVWTGLTLAWGVYIGCWFDSLLNEQPGRNSRADDYSYIICIWCANVLLFILGFIVPFMTPNLRGSVGDAVLVINVFYSTFLVTCTMGLIKWSTDIYNKHPPTQLSDVE